MTRAGAWGVGAMLVGGALAAGASRFAHPGDWLALATGGTLLAGGLSVLLSSFSPSQGVLLQLDWFLPFLRKKKQRETLARSRLPMRMVRAVLPGTLLADREKGRPGLIRRALSRIGPTALSSPARRVVQAACLLLFLWLFFVVCWPYGVRPRENAVSSGWAFAEIDETTGAFHFARPSPSAWRLQAGESVHVTDEWGDVDGGYVGEFTVANLDGVEIFLEPVAEMSPKQLDAVLLGAGPWSLSEERPGRWPSHYADDLHAHRTIAAELFLAIDPLVSLSTAIAARSWVWSLASAGVILIVCVLMPRGFCGYLCPLGTLIDLFDWAFTQRVARFRVAGNGWWVHVKYVLLAGTLVSALFGVLLSGYVAAIPVVTRGVLFLGDPLQTAVARGAHLIPPINAGHVVSVVLFLAVLGLGFLRPRFWCKYVCPSGAVFSLGNLLRVSERKVESSCIHCNKCVEICPFDAIKPDFTTRVIDCTLCQTCGGVCPTQSIKFVERWNHVDLKTLDDPPTGETAIGRRGFLSATAGTAAALVGGAGLAGVTKAFGADLENPEAFLPVRPPGSVPEAEFLQMCIRCGECFKVCPNNVLQPEGFQQGLEGLWTPLVEANWAGCESSCNRCGQVCPTGAIRALPIDEKRVARMGLAIVDEQTCLPFAQREACQLCADECAAAGYDAIMFLRVGTQVDKAGDPIAESGFLAPVVLAEECVGCGLCQTRCHGINVKQRGVLESSAIVIEVVAGREDRLTSGSYIELREDEAQRKQQRKREDDGGFFVPDLGES